MTHKNKHQHSLENARGIEALGRDHTYGAESKTSDEYEAAIQEGAKVTI